METPSNAIQLNDKRTINAWAMFDWANSSYALVIAVAIFPLYFNSEGVMPDGVFYFLGIPVTKTSLFSYSLTFAYIIIAAALPILSGIADYGGKKMYFMKFFTAMGSIACISLVFFTSDTIVLGVFGFVIATVGFAGGQIFYNSFLPLIATEDQLDKASAKGFAYGYIGSVLLLIVNLVMIQKYEWFGFPDAEWPVRLSFVMVGLWWMGFAQITFNRLPKDNKQNLSSKILLKGFQELQKVWQIVKRQKNIKRFLFSFFFYSAGVQTVLYLASTFATDELKFGATDLIMLILILQLVAIGGAYLFAALSNWKGNKVAIITMLLIWIGICVLAYFVQHKNQFFIVAALVGMVMGGIQSVSRSTYSKLIPSDTKDTASFFSFYDVLEKVAIVMGTFSFGFIDQMMGGMRNSILALIVYFAIGLLVIFTVKVKPAKIA
jgi:UMF1 family MFS transporter